MVPVVDDLSESTQLPAVGVNFRGCPCSSNTRPMLPRHFQQCSAFKQRLYRGSAFVEDGKEHPETSRHRPLIIFLSRVPTDVCHECQTGMTTKTTLYQVAHTSLQQTYVSPALQQPSCAVSPFLSTTFGLAPLLIKYLTASLGPAPA